MDLVKDLQKWKKDLEDLGMEKIKAEGRYEQGLADLKNLGFETLEDAKIELAKRVAQLQAAQEEAKSLLEGFKEKYADYIE